MKKKIVFLICLCVLFTYFASALSVSAHAASINNTPIVVDGTVTDIDITNNNGLYRIYGSIQCGSTSISFDSTVKFWKLVSSDKLNGTIVAEIIDDNSQFNVVNISIGSNREAALNPNNVYDTNTIMVKVALHNSLTNTIYNAYAPTDASLIALANTYAVSLSQTTNADLYCALVDSEKWYNTVFRSNMISTNEINVIDTSSQPLPALQAEDISLMNQSDTASTLASGINYSLDDLLYRVGESKFQTPNLQINSGVSYTANNGYHGYYLETYENGDNIIVTFVVYYDLTANIVPNNTYASLSMRMRYNREIWYYTDSGQYEDYGICQIRIRNVGAAISLTGNNPDFIYSVTSNANTSSGTTAIPDFGISLVPIIGGYLAVAANIFNSITTFINSELTSNGVYTFEYPNDPQEHYAQVGSYIREVTTEIEQGFNNKWFIDTDDVVVLRANYTPGASTSSKTVTYHLKYEVCTANAWGFYATVRESNGYFNKYYN